jgi:hypothetical protein
LTESEKKKLLIFKVKAPLQNYPYYQYSDDNENYNDDEQMYAKQQIQKTTNFDFYRLNEESPIIIDNLLATLKPGKNFKSTGLVKGSTLFGFFKIKTKKNLL